MTPSSFFGTSLRRDPNQPADLNARIEAQLRERLEEAVDFVCLEALVKRRQALSLPAPSADNTRDREEFTRSVHTFLAELASAIAPTLSACPRAAWRRRFTATRCCRSSSIRRVTTSTGKRCCPCRKPSEPWNNATTAST